MSLNRRLAAWAPRLSLGLAVVLLLAVAALVGRVGSDARWLAAMGRLIATRGAIPAGIPFAADASSHWPNVPVLGELVFHWLEQGLGDRGLMLAQLLACATALAVLAADSLSGGAEAAGIGRALLLAGVSSIPALAIARSQLFSLFLFPVLCWLIRADSRRPSNRIWLAVPLLALWSNLHGGALVGLAVLEGYLLVGRLRAQPVRAVLVGVAAAAAICATPALLGTVSYYWGVLGGQAPSSGQGLWAPLSLSSPLDVLFIVCAAVLLVQFWRARPSRWEQLVSVGLTVLAVQAGRNGVWLVLFLVPAAARSFAPRRQWQLLAVPVALASVGILAFGLIRGPVLQGASPRLVARALSLAHGSPVLASSTIDEQVALAGGSIVVGDPIDAFPAREQVAYLDWLNGSRRALAALGGDVRVILVMRTGAARRTVAQDPAFALAGGDAQALLYARRGLPGVS
ncbi:MAG TPA: hypothetical protein VE983_00215 [Solirubrobacteraceae bacterium]|nr:hypothetical protein [Solirubrobacteraceae bacterium]